MAKGKLKGEPQAFLALAKNLLGVVLILKPQLRTIAWFAGLLLIKADVRCILPLDGPPQVDDGLSCHWLCWWTATSWQPGLQASLTKALPSSFSICSGCGLSRSLPFALFLTILESGTDHSSLLLDWLNCLRQIVLWALMSSFLNGGALPSIFVILWNEGKPFSLWLDSKMRLGD